MGKFIIRVVTAIGLEETLILLITVSLLAMIAVWMRLHHPMRPVVAALTWLPAFAGALLCLRECLNGWHLITFLQSADALSEPQKEIFQAMTVEQAFSAAFSGIVCLFVVRFAYRAALARLATSKTASSTMQKLQAP